MVVLKNRLFVLAVVDNLTAFVGLGGGLEVHKAARVFPVIQHNINSSLAPLRFSGRRENFPFFKLLNDTNNTLTTEI